MFSFNAIWNPLILSFFFIFTFVAALPNYIFDLNVVKPDFNEHVPNDIDLLLRMKITTNMSLQLPIKFTANFSCNDIFDIFVTAPSTLTQQSFDNENQFTYYVKVKDVRKCLGHQMDIYLNITDAMNTTASRYWSARILSNYVSVFYIIWSCASVSFCTMLMFLYLRFPVLRKYPSNLVFWRTMCDLLFAIQFIWLNAWEMADAQRAEVCNFGIAFVTQFSMLGSLNWYFVLALNAYFSISNPFRMPQSKTTLYHLGVWSSAIFTALVTGIKHDYRQDFRLCWVQKVTGFNIWNWLCFYTWLIVFSIYSVGILIWANSKLKGGVLDSTISTRKESLRQTRIYVLVFTFYWAVAGSIWVAVYFISTDSASDVVLQNRQLSYIFAFVSGIMGLLDVITWLYIQWKPLTEAWKKGNHSKDLDSEFNDISDALRHEFIKRMSESIQASTEKEYAKYIPPEVSKNENDGDIRPSLSKRASLGPPDDSDETEVSIVEVRRSENDASSPPARFLSYSTPQFVTLRNIFGVTKDDYMASMKGEVKEMRKNFSEGASGSFFYFTVDMKYMVKTMSLAEHLLLRRIIKGYTRHMKENPKSYLCRFFGLYSIELYGHVEYVLVMNNFLRPPCDSKGVPLYKINEIFDLKGSSINRHAKRKKLGKKSTKIGVLKDNDLQKTVQIGRAAAEEVIQQLKRDSEFMREQNIMDYSLLLGIHNCTERRQADSHCNGLIHHTNSPSTLLSPHQSSLNTITTSTNGVGVVGGGTGAGTGAGTGTGTGTGTGSVTYSALSIHSIRNTSSASTLLPPHAFTSSLPPQTTTFLPYSASNPLPPSFSPNSSLEEPSKNYSITGDVRVQNHISHGGNEDDKKDDKDKEEKKFESRMKGPIAEEKSEGIAASVIVGPGIYHIGIIDVLQQWNWKKRLEQYTKIILQCHCNDYKELSAVEPKLYSERFTSMVEKLFE